jgi:16S rRNA (uracil1498-N3)-methyltransferase
MALPFFYVEQLVGIGTLTTLEEDTSKHVVQVLRMKVDDKLQLTDGKGNLYTVEIAQVHKKSTVVKTLSSVYYPPSAHQVSIAISLIKNVARFEWFLEKATEIGVNEIIPLICERTEKYHFRYDRMKNILVSAMLQSQQSWLPKLSAPVLLTPGIHTFNHPQKFIAHCADGKKNLIGDSFNQQKDALLLIGPEGDFSQHEIDLALQHNFQPISLGNTRLRTETAGIVAAILLKNYF